METTSTNVSSTTETKKPTSHEYARNVKAFAEFLLSRPEFEMPWTPTYLGIVRYWGGDKERFLAAARALGTGKKKYEHDDIEFTVTHEWGEFTIRAPRNSVCRLVRPAQYECDPFFSDAELSEIGGEK